MMAHLEGPKRGRRDFFTVIFYLMVIVVLQSDDASAKVPAKKTYYVDSKSDCIYAGSLDLPRDQTTYIRVYADTRSNALTCTLQFTPEQDGDTLQMWFEQNAYIGNCGVSMTMTMKSNSDDNFQLGCRSVTSTVNMKAVNGKGILRFVRGNIGNFNYKFIIGVRAERTVVAAGSNDSSTGDVGMIVGIIGGAIVAIILICVLCVCCYRRRKRDRDFKVQGTTPKSNLAFENGKLRDFQDDHGGSPSSEKRLLQSSKEYDAEEGLKPKSALDRFGPTPARRSDRPSVDNDRRDKADVQEKSFAVKEENNAPQQRSPILDALRKNPKFRNSFHNNEVDADSRARRVSGSVDSSLSYDSNGVPIPPRLPPVPRSPQRSPSPQRKGEKIAGIFRARPSSSSSEIARQLEGDPVENGDESPSEFVPSIRKEKKADTRHTLRPNRGERKTRPDDRRNEEEEEDSDEERRRKKQRQREEKEKMRRKLEDEDREEEREEERRRKKERDRRRREEKEEEEEKKERRRRERDDEDDRLEGRFKKSASGRRSKGKGNRKGRSKSTSNALEEMEDNYQRSRSKSPSSVRSLNFIEDDDDDDLDSNYMPFKRAGSKQSLYASRSSLYGRRRKNSMGETVSLSSYAYDDLDSRYGDFDKKGMSRKEKERMFRSTGELEMHGATALVVRECATQTDSSKAVYVYGRKTLAKSRPGKMYSRGCQTLGRRGRKDSTGSAHSTRSSRMKKSRSQESLRKGKRSRSRNLDESYDSSDNRSRRSMSRDLDDSYDSSDNRSRRSRSRNRDYSDDDDGQRGRKKKHHRSKSRGLEDDEDDRLSSKDKNKPKARPRKSTGATSVDLSDSDGGHSQAASSVAPSYISQPMPYGAHYVPVMLPPQPGMTYLPTAPGGPPLVPGNPKQHPSAMGPKPPLAPKPKKSKWDQLVEMTDGQNHRQRQQADSPTESMLTSTYSHQPGGAHQAHYYAPPSYNTAQKYPDPNNSTISSAYPDSSGMPLSGMGPGYYNYRPSESEI